VTATLDVSADVAMLACLHEYRRAVDALAALEREPSPDPDEHLCAAEAVIRARMRMSRNLVANGWTPPPALAAAMALDTALSGESNGALGG
jgi:hypothetical protein